MTSRAEPGAPVAIIWTRAAVHWPLDRQRFKADAPLVYSAPAIELRDRALDLGALSSFRPEDLAIVITSPRTLESIERQGHLGYLKRCREILSFGEATLAKAKSLGLNQLRSFGPQIRSGKELSAALGQHYPKEQPIAVLGAETKAFPLQKDLLRQGFQKVFDLAVYATVERLVDAQGQPLRTASDLLDRVAFPRNMIVALASPSACRAFEKIFVKDDWGLSNFYAACLGQTTEFELQGRWIHSERAKAQSIESLVALSESLVQSLLQSQA